LPQIGREFLFFELLENFRPMARGARRKRAPRASKQLATYEGQKERVTQRFVKKPARQLTGNAMVHSKDDLDVLASFFEGERGNVQLVVKPDCGLSETSDA
jgi:hypothetical protein